MEAGFYTVNMKAVTAGNKAGYFFKIIVKAKNDRAFYDVSRAGVLGEAPPDLYKDNIQTAAKSQLSLQLFCEKITSPDGRDITAMYREIFEYHGFPV